VEEPKFSAIGVSPCVALFMELLVAGVSPSRASDEPMDFQPEGPVTQPTNPMPLQRSQANRHLADVCGLYLKRQILLAHE